MKNQSRITYALTIALTFVIAFTLGACVGKNLSSGSSSQPAEPSSAVSAVSSASAPASSAAASSPSASYSAQGQSSSSTATAPVDEDSYADNHLSGDSYSAPDITVERNGTYTDKDHVALYIHTYGTVPSNYISKTKARKAGWVNTKGNLWDVLPGMSIGGGGFYNDDHMLPDAPDREWFECDIDYEGGYRNAKRIVYSNDGLIYYTDDHYESFQRLY